MKFNLKRKLAGFLAVFMVFSVMVFDQTGILVNAEDDIAVSFLDGTVNGNIISYAVGEETVTATVLGAEIASSMITVSYSNMESVTFTLSDNFDSDTMQVRVYASDGFSATLSVTNNVTSLAAKTNDGGLPAALNLVVEQKNANSDEQGPNLGEGTNPGEGSNPGEGTNPGEEDNAASWELDLMIGSKEYYGLRGDHSYLIDKRRNQSLL